MSGRHKYTTQYYKPANANANIRYFIEQQYSHMVGTDTWVPYRCLTRGCMAGPTFPVSVWFSADTHLHEVKLYFWHVYKIDIDRLSYWKRLSKESI